jgi:hypothetical protein
MGSNMGSNMGSLVGVAELKIRLSGGLALTIRAIVLPMLVGVLPDQGSRRRLVVQEGGETQKRSAKHAA